MAALVGNRLLGRMLQKQINPLLSGGLSEASRLGVKSGGQPLLTAGMLLGRKPRRFGMPHETFLGRSLSAANPQPKMPGLFPIRRFLGG